MDRPSIGVFTQGLFKYFRLRACSNMSSLRFSSKALLVLTLFTSSFSPLIVADNTHTAEKRQIGVLARTGALPQGKRSVEVLARNGELPHGGGKKDASDEDTDDSLLEELERAEKLSKLRAQLLAKKLFRQLEPSDYDYAAKRSVAALARNGELPQKRLSETMARSGYLVKPSLEAAPSPSELLLSEDFLADGQSSVIPEFLNEREFRTFLSAAKRSLGSAKNFLLDSYDKRNLGSLAREGSFHGPRYSLANIRKVRHDKKSFADEDFLPDCCDYYPYRLTESVESAPAIRRRDDPRSEAFADGISLEKRFLGRIPQLGRIHQKTQSPSSRRRPHLRPNWF